jgi:hypothetical protein
LLHQNKQITRVLISGGGMREGFGQGCRWVELLGFEFEGRMKGYGLNGETHLRYAKVI